MPYNFYHCNVVRNPPALRMERIDFGLPRSPDHPPQTVGVRSSDTIFSPRRSRPRSTFPHHSLFTHYAAHSFPPFLHIRHPQQEYPRSIQSKPIPLVSQPLHSVMPILPRLRRKGHTRTFPLPATRRLSPLFIFLYSYPLSLNTVVSDKPQRFTSLKRRRSPHSSIPFKLFPYP